MSQYAVSVGSDPDIIFVCAQDVGLSKDLNENFRKHLANTGDTLDVDFSIQVRGIRACLIDLFPTNRGTRHIFVNIS
jgi:hypothetical protein